MDEKLSQLRDQLLQLKPEGDDGLEGLTAHALAAFMGRQFRLARAGRQHGRDGATAPGPFDVFFEAKLYAGKPPSTETLQAKLMSAINAHHPNLDVWVLASTASMGENSVNELIRTGERFGVTVVTLDWSSHPLPLLAVLLASEKEAVLEWLRARVTDIDVDSMQHALDAISGYSPFGNARAELTQYLSADTAGWGAARASNSAWLTERFSDRTKARQAFGQFVAPNDPGAPAISRRLEIEQIETAMSDQRYDIVALIGDEGVGKTWLTAMAWKSLDDRPLLLLCTTDITNFELGLRDPLRFLAELLVKQSLGIRGNDAVERWVRRLENWRTRSPGPVRIWLALDGLNERESRSWVSLIDKLMPLAPGLGMRLLLTSRPTFFTQQVLPRLSGYRVRKITAPPFSEQELIDGLQRVGVNAHELPGPVRQFLRNPRIFSIAISMFDRVNPNELTRERLLFEYWRKRVEERTHLRHSDHDVRCLLISHARTIREQLQNAQTPATASFRRDLWKEHSGLAKRISDPTIDDELSEVEEGRFFESDPDQEGNYRIRADGLAYALGLLLIDEVSSAPQSEMLARLEAAIDPIRGLDLVADVMLAALGVACLDPKCSDVFAAAILHSLLGLQNLPEASSEVISAYVTTRPPAFIEAAEMQWSGEFQQHGRSEWLSWFLFQKRDHDSVRPHLDEALRRWLALWSSEPDQWPRYGLSTQQLQKQEETEHTWRTQIDQRLTSLTTEERSYLERYCHKVETPRLMYIDALALELLAGRPLASFAEAVVGWHLCESLTHRHHGARDELNWVIRLNPVDVEATAKQLRETLQRLDSQTPSLTGQWTAIGTLRVTGLSADAERADLLVQRLGPAQFLPGWRRVETFCDTDPLDPEAREPSNLTRATERIGQIDVDNLHSAMSTTMDDHDLRDLTPALARFDPDTLITKLREFARDFGRRSGPAARFLAFDVSSFSAVLTEADVRQLGKAYLAFAASPETEADEEQQIGAQYLLLALLPHLAAADQLDALLAIPGDNGENIKLRDHFKSLEPAALAQRLELALAANSIKSLRRTLYFASSGQHPFNSRSRQVVQTCFGHSDPVIRLIAFDAAAQHPDEALITELARSNWSTVGAGAESVESFYGSKALALVPGPFQNVDTLMRMSLGWQTRVVEPWGEDCIQQHGEIILQLVRDTLGLPPDLIPDIPIQRKVDTPTQPSRYPYLDTAPETPEKESLQTVLQRMASETDASWKAKEARKREAIKTYVRELKKYNVGTLIDPVYVKGLSVLAAKAPGLFDSIVELLSEADRHHLQNLASMLACAALVLSRTEQDQAADLFERIRTVQPDINLVIGPAELPFHRLALWLAEDGPRINEVRFAQLQSAPNDAALFTECLCAADAAKATLVLEHAERLIATGHPGDMARGIMIAGLCDANDIAARILNDPRWTEGFLAQVATAARAAYDRNVWARHWYEKACSAADAVAFWRYCSLMIAASDGRFILWFRPVDELRNASLGPFAFFVAEGLERRAKKKRKKRDQTLLGLKPPSDGVLRAIIAA